MSGTVARACPASYRQRAVWQVCRQHPDTRFYNRYQAYGFEGPLDAARLRRCLDAIVDRHESLRTVFEETETGLVQRILPSCGVDCAPADLSQLSGPAQAAALQREERLWETPFDVTSGPLLRCRLVQLGATSHRLLVCAHHLILDGPSWTVFGDELARLYRGDALAPPALQYGDFAVAEEQRRAQGAWETHEAWWRERLAGAEPLLRLPADHPRPGEQSFRGGVHWQELPAGLVAALRTHCAETGTTLFRLACAAFAVLAGRLSAQSDLLIGTTLAGRHRPELRAAIGFFNTPALLRVALDADPRFDELARAVHAEIDALVQREELPFERLLRYLKPIGDRARGVAYSVNFTQQPPERAWQLGALQLRLIVTANPQVALHDLSVYLCQSGPTVRLQWLYHADLFEDATIARFAAQYARLLEQIVCAPTARIGSFSLVTDACRAVLADPATPLPAPDHAPVTRAFEAWAGRTPRQTAVEDGAETLDYQTLRERAHALAQSLRAQGVGPGAPVAVAGPRSTALVVSMLAVWYAGGILLLLDPALPAARRRELLARAHARFLVAIGAAAHDLDVPLPRIDVSIQGRAVAETPVEDALPELRGSDPAYVFFTSGSSGSPKAVLGEHRGVAQLLDWQRSQFTVGPPDRVVSLLSLSFDALLRETFLPLTSGATLVLPPAPVEADGAQVLPWLARCDATIVHGVPSLAQHWLRSAPPGVALPRLRLSFFTGEPLTDSLVRAWRPLLARGSEIVNLYGPTETTLIKYWYRVPAPPHPGVQPVGRPLPATQAIVLNGAGLQCAVGEPGEIVLRTPFRTRGYLDDAAANARCFVPNPHTGDPGDLLYRTGDRGRVRADGLLEVLGRLDNQVKIRGVRVEPGEVMAMLAQCPGVRDCAVLPFTEHGEPALAAYVAGERSDAQWAAELRASLSRRAPAAMVPTAVLFVPELPRLPNGKLDRNALPPPECAARAEYVAPRDALEEAVAGVWREALGTNGVGALDNFFELGGSSLEATQVASRLRALFAVELPPQAVMVAPTLAALAEQIRSGVAAH